MPKPERTAAILVAAGRGLRAGAGGPKQYRTIGGQTVIYRAMEAFSRHPDVAVVQPVVNPDDSAMRASVAGIILQPHSMKCVRVIAARHFQGQRGNA